jgi:hypothetical protein
MDLLQWSKSEIDYGRRLMDSAVEGARRGEGEFLKGECLRPHLERSALHAITPTLVGVCLGWLSGSFENCRSRRKALFCALIGGALGFGAAVAWENRRMTASVASGAWKNISKTRDEHWFEKNPIDYA